MDTRRLVRTSALAILTATACGCSTWNKLDNQEKGAVIGGGTGALVGNAISPGVGGTAVGGGLDAVAGGVIGHQEDMSERLRR